MVDTEGWLTELMVQPVNLSESAGAKLVLGTAKAAERRLGKDDEALTSTSDSIIWEAVGTSMLRRLAKRGTS